MLKSFYKNIKNSLNKPIYKIGLGISFILGSLNLSGCNSLPQEPFKRLNLKTTTIIGTIDSSGKSNSERAHKSMIGTGLEASWEGDIKKTAGLNLEGMFESPDRDDQVPHEFARVYGGVSFPVRFVNGKFMPYIDVGINKWGRHGTDPKFYGDMLFTDFRAGVGFDYKYINFKLGAIQPVWVGVDSGKIPKGKLGFELDATTPLKFLGDNVRGGLFYDNYKFNNAPNTDKYGVMLEIKFGKK